MDKSVHKNIQIILNRENKGIGHQQVIQGRSLELTKIEAEASLTVLNMGVMMFMNMIDPVKSINKGKIAINLKGELCTTKTKIIIKRIKTLSSCP